MSVFEYDDDPIVTRLVNEDTVPWYKKPNLRNLYLILFPACMGIEITSGFDSQLINALQFIHPFNKYFGDGYIDPTTHQLGVNPPLLGIINASYSLRAICAVPVAPYFNQLVGRRWAIMSSSIAMVIGALLQGFAQHGISPGLAISQSQIPNRTVAMYIIARMLVGFGIVFVIISGSAIIGELAYPKERPIMTYLPLQRLLLLRSYHRHSHLTRNRRNRRKMGRENPIPAPMPGIIGELAYPKERPIMTYLPLQRLLLLRSYHRHSHLTRNRRNRRKMGRENPIPAPMRPLHPNNFRLLDILVKYHAEGDRDSLFVRAEMTEIKTTIKLEMVISKQSWLDMIRTADEDQYCQQMLVPHFRWNRRRNSNRFPRRRMFLLCTISTLFVFISWTMEKALSANAHRMTNNAAAIAVLFFIFAYSPCYNIGNSALTYTYLIELFPFAERSRGIAIEQFFGRGAGFFSTYVNPIALKAITWKYHAVYCGWIFVEICFVYFLYPETYGRTLEELASLFEDKSLSENVASAVEKQINYGDVGVEPHPGKRSFAHLESVANHVDPRLT
ncbi:related to hexose transporter protein [Phialocephala subalpina]|uniref:Related to hexose transporter protein n=1 Tax=Phialocephala subalpina TaxID=576137 RepID=A0A1L7WK97_9HELO|nr:related to hexose transporter protein [Phialocephala subalpina]